MAKFIDTFGGMTVVSLFNGLEIEEGEFENEDDAAQAIANRHERLTTTRRQRFARSMSKVVSHGTWGAIAATAAIIGAVLSGLAYMNTLPKDDAVAPNEVSVQADDAREKSTGSDAAKTP